MKQSKRLLGGLLGNSLIGGFVFFVFFGVIAQTAYAATVTINVNDTGDTDDGSCDHPYVDAATDCTLREAIDELNAVVSGSDDYVIDVPAGPYTISSGEYEIYYTLGSVTLSGAGSGSTIIDANNTDRAFTIYGSTDVTIDNMELTNGSVTSEEGGLIISSGALVLDSVILDTGETATSGYSGGLIKTTADLSIIDSTLNDGTSGAHGGLIRITAGGSVDVSISGSTLDNGTSSGSFSGGAIYYSTSGSTNTLSISDTTISSNTSARSGGGIYISGNVVTDIDNTLFDSNTASTTTINTGGGAIYQSSSSGNSTTITNSTFFNNILIVTGEQFMQLVTVKYI